MRKVSIALRRLGVSEFSSLTRAELRALRRETEPWSEDLDLFLKDMVKIDQGSPEEDSPSGSNGGAVLSPEPTQDREEESLSQSTITSPERFPGTEPDSEYACVPPPGGQDGEQSTLENDKNSEHPNPVSSEPENVYPSPVGDSGEVVLYSRRENQDGFSVTFQLKGNGEGPNAGELTVYSHTSETQLSGLGDSQDSAFAVAVPASSYVRLGPDRASRGWEHLTLKGPADVLATEAVPIQEAPVPRVPVPDEMPGSLWAVPVEVFAKTRTRLALTNATDQPCVVKLYLLDGKGNRLAGKLDPKLNPLPPNWQVLESVDRYFPELIGLAEFYGTIVVRVEREGQIWAMGVIGDEPESLTIRRALNMNIDLEGLKAKMAKELESIAAREATLQEQMVHLEAVLCLADGNGDSGKASKGRDFARSSSSNSEADYSEASGS